MSEEQRTVLIVDDQEDARLFAETVVSEVGDFKIITASDGDTAVQKAKEAIPDLIILDVMMPGKDGFHAFYDMRQDEGLANTPIIMLTGVSKQTGIKFSEKDMDEYLGEKPFAFLDKPVDAEELEETVRKALGL